MVANFGSSLIFPLPIDSKPIMAYLNLSLKCSSSVSVSITRYVDLFLLADQQIDNEEYRKTLRILGDPGTIARDRNRMFMS